MKLSFTLLLILGFLDQSCGWCLEAVGSCTHTPRNEEVWIYVFSGTGSPCWNIISYHSGIAFTDKNGVSKYWMFSVGGVTGYPEGCSKEGNGMYQYKKFLGRLPWSMDQFQGVVDRLSGKKGYPCSYKNGKDDCFTSSTYWNILWNCNYFTAWLADEIGFWDNYPGTLWTWKNIG